jgi:riboflavin kinase/FMN adenylyltransferase
LLNSLEEKKKLIKGLGVDEFITIPFNKDFSKNTTEVFLRDFLKEKYGVTTLIIGYDHRFGHDKVSQEEMIKIANGIGIEVIRVDEFVLQNKVISSTKIRNLLAEGDIEGANIFLGYKYSLTGVVVAGERIGRTIGFPTANIKLYEPLKVVPADGVYLVEVELLDKRYVGISNIGVRPTIGEHNEKTIEVHILNFDEDIYGLDITISFVKCIRNEKKFASLGELKKQLEVDKRVALDYLQTK